MALFVVGVLGTSNLTIVQAGASGTAALTSGTYLVVANNAGTAYSSTWVLNVAGGKITGESHWTCCPGPRVDPLSGSTGGGKVTINRDCSNQGQTACVHQTFTGTITAPGVVSGTWTGDGAEGGDTWTLMGKPPNASLVVSIALSKTSVTVGSNSNVTISVSAVGGDVDAINFGGGLLSSLVSVASVQPANNSDFDLSDGDSRTFNFTVSAKNVGSTQLSIVAMGVLKSGVGVQGSAKVDLKIIGNSVTGTIQYLYLSGSGYAQGDASKSVATLTPARGTEVVILGASHSACYTTVLSKTYTDDAGTYTSATIKPTEKYVCLQVIAATKYSIVLPFSGSHDVSDAYTSDTIGPKALSTSGTTTFSWTPTSGDEAIDQALDINNAVLTGARWLDLYGVTSPLAKILYPYPTTLGVSNFQPLTGDSTINKDDAFDWGVLLHEYGHYVASKIGLDNLTRLRSGFHSLSQNMTNVEGSKAEGLAISWNEGFADFFSQMVQRAMDTASLGLPDVGASPPIYIDQTPTGVISLQLDSPGSSQPNPSLGEDNEVSVSRVLWALYNQPKYAGVDGSVAFVKILSSSMTSDELRNLFVAVDALESAQRAEPWVPDVGRHSTDVDVPVHYDEASAATIFGTILSDQNVAPTITSTQTTHLGRVLEVKWSAGQRMTASDKLNLFAVQVWDRGWTTLLSEAVGDSTSSPQVVKDGATIYEIDIPIPPTWPQGELHAVVLGWNTRVAPDGLTVTGLISEIRDTGDYPLTGPYVSAPAGFVVGR